MSKIISTYIILGRKHYEKRIHSVQGEDTRKILECITKSQINPYPTAFPYGNGMVLHFYQQQESSTNKTVHKVINRGLKAYV